MIEQGSSTRYRFIPYRKRDVVEMCLEDGALQGQEDPFRQWYYMLSSIFHFEFHQVIESLKDRYAGVDPDADTRAYDNQQPLAGLDFVELLGGLLEKANYEQISQSELNQALTEASLFQIRLQVDFSDFSDVLLFCRGVSQRKETIRSWLGLVKKQITFTNYDRVVLYIRFRDDFVQDAHDSHMPLCKPGATLLKLFQNVPRADLEMLFPNTAVRMRPIDKLLIGVPAVISGGIVLTTKLGASLLLLGSLLGFWLGLSSEPVELNKTSVMVLLAGIVALGGYLWKQFNNFKNRKLRFMQALTQNLYFKNLDNNAGVFHRLANDAEEEECKEAVLAYYFLLSVGPMSKAALDEKIENWLLSQWQCAVDFEINDALTKLLSLELVAEKQGVLTAVSIEDGIALLDRRWDDYFVSAG
ncbi:MAG: TMEM143 family protein [Gammaproteobacteria bacterium]